MKTNTAIGNAADKVANPHPEASQVNGMDAEHQNNSTNGQAAATPTSNVETCPKGPAPDEVFSKRGEIHHCPEDSAQARNLYGGSYFLVREEQNEFLAGCLRSGDYIRDPESVSERNNTLFPKFPFYPGEPLFAPVVYHMSCMLAANDGAENVIWNNRGFSTGYQLPGGNGRFLGAMHPWVLNHFQFLTIPKAFEEEGLAQVGIDQFWFFRILSHGCVEFISPNEKGDGWQAGPTNRFKDADGIIHGSVDYVITHPDTGELYLTPHGLLAIHKNISQWARMIF